MPNPISTPRDRSPIARLGGRLPLSLVLVFVTLLVFVQVREFDFIVWDDPLYVTANPHIQAGLNGESLHWAFTTHHGALWHPLTWISHMIDYRLYGLSPAGHHLTNLFWHLLNGLLLFLLLHRLTGEIWPGFLAALLFAVHPLRAESVAWVTERKDVMSTCFWLLTTGFYVRYVRSPGLMNQVLVAVGLGLGLMVKPMLVTLPFALLLLDFWPLGRARTLRAWLPLLREKIPLFVIVLLAVVTAIWAQHAATALNPLDIKPLSLRIGNAVVSYAAYLYKCLWPAGLSPIYPYADSFPVWKLGAAAIVLAGVTWFAWRFRNRFPYVLTGWLWFVGTLVPVIGIVQAGAVAMADRFTYIPSIGLVIMASWGVKDFLSAHPSFRTGVVCACAAVVAALSVSGHAQVGYWRDSVSLFQRALNVQEKNPLAHGCLGATWIQKGELKQAEKHLTRALELNPHYPEALNDLGTILTETGRHQEAIESLSRAIRLNPNYVEAHNNLALTFTRVNRFPEAVEHYRTALSLHPGSADTLNNMGIALAQTGRAEEAKRHFLRALAVQPGYDRAYDNLGRLHFQQQDYAQSKAYFETALSYHPNNPRAFFFLGLIASAQGREQEAADCFTHALKLDPGFQEAAEELQRIGNRDQGQQGAGPR